jgi:TolC family type I secretion outer membrane protein
MMALSGAFCLLAAGIPFSAAIGAEVSAKTDLSEIQTLDLETAQKIALSDNPSLAAAEARVRQAKEQIRQARSAYWPHLSATGIATRSTLSDNAYSERLATNPWADDTTDTYRVGLTATWTLFDGFSREYSALSARYGMESSQEARRDAQRLLLSSVATSFYNAQLAQENIAISEANADFNQQQLDEAEAKYRVGTGSLSDVLNFQVQINSAKSDLINSKKAFETALYGLAALMGVTDAELPGHIELATLEVESREELTAPDREAAIDYALANRPDVKKAYHTLARSEASVGTARSGFLPTVSLSGTLDATEVDNRDFEPDDFGNSVSLSVSLPIFAGFANRARLAEAAAGVRESENSLEQTLINLRAEVSEAVSDLASAQEQLTLQRSNVELVQRVRDLVAEEYTAGQTSLVRLNEAQKDLVTAQGNLARSLVSMRWAWVSLRVATGEVLGQAP